MEKEHPITKLSEAAKMAGNGVGRLVPRAEDSDAAETGREEPRHISKTHLETYRSSLKGLRSNKVRDMEVLERQLYDLRAKMDRLQTEINVINSRERAVNAHIRSLEDDGILG